MLKYEWHCQYVLGFDNVNSFGGKITLCFLMTDKSWAVIKKGKGRRLTMQYSPNWTSTHSHNSLWNLVLSEVKVTFKSRKTAIQRNRREGKIFNDTIVSIIDIRDQIREKVHVICRQVRLENYF